MLKKIIVLLLILGLSFAMLLTTTGESHFEVQSHARFSTPPGDVWQILVAVDRWSDWWPGMDEAWLVGSLTEGSEIELRLKGMPASDPARLSRVRSLKELAWEGPGVLGSRAGTRFLLEPDAEGSLVTIENYVRGPQAFLTRFTGEEAFSKYQQKLLNTLALFLDGQLPVVREKD